MCPSPLEAPVLASGLCLLSTCQNQLVWEMTHGPGSTVRAVLLSVTPPQMLCLQHHWHSQLASSLLGIGTAHEALSNLFAEKSARNVPESESPLPRGSSVSRPGAQSHYPIRVLSEDDLLSCPCVPRT